MRTHSGGRTGTRRFVPRATLGAGLLAVATTLGLGACSGTSGSNGDECLSNQAYFEREVWAAFMSSNCTKCHTPDGPAVAESKAKFVLEPSSYPGFMDANYAMLQEIAKIQYEGQSELLLKPLGQMSHGGGTALEESSDEYKALSELVARFSDGDPCPDSTGRGTLAIKSLDAPDTLRKAALDLVGRLPTEEETNAVKQGGDVALDTALDAIMKEDAFYERLREIFNDILLTDRWLSSDRSAINFMDTNIYPWLQPYRDSSNPNYNDPIYRDINRALAREPLTLINYVVRNDKPFTDIVAADYAVVNPFLAKAYGLDGMITFNDPTDENEYHEAQVTLGNGTEIPHAGVMSTPSFLNRWTTTETNRNRGRARRVFSFFLATDVLKISERPVDATAVSAVSNPTLNSSLCTVCHTVIDPVAGAFRGYDDSNYEYFDPSMDWHTDMLPPGFHDVDMDPGFYKSALQWLGKEMVKDPRFARSAVYTVYKGLTGHEPLSYPRGDDPKFSAKLTGWQVQDEFFGKAADDFVASNFNLKTVFKAVIKSPYYRGVSAAPLTDLAALKDIGTGRLLTPEMLNRKVDAIAGIRWRKTYEWDRNHDWLNEDYKILYGGIDSLDVPSRLTSPNGVVASVAARMANEVACKATAFDFTKAKDARQLFPYVDLSEVPESSGNPVEGSITDIKKNIQYLHERILGEHLELDDPEIERSYQLFLDTWHELSKNGDTGLLYDCSGRWDNTTGQDLADADQIKDDPNFTVRSWMAVTTYLFSDWKFLYE